MSDQNTPGPAPLDVRPPRADRARRLSYVWLVPIFALAVSLGVAYQSYANRGVLIEIAFDNASGIIAGETVIKYRDVEVGTVESLAFSPGLDVIVVSARVDKGIAPFLDDDAQFWVVTPDVSVRGISGLETVLSGVFIEGTWDTEADVAQTAFIGLEDPPLTRANQRGTAIVLRASDGSALTSGAPILHKGIEVGFLETPELAPDGETVIVNGFVEAPYDRRITSNTRFWDTSGFSVQLGAGGVSLNVDSLASLIEGGIAFDTVVSGGTPVVNGQRFNLFENESLARESLFDDGDIGQRVNVSVLFDGSVNGLSVGSDVRFQGLVVGEVVDLSAVVVDGRDATRVQLRAVLGIDPTKIGMLDNPSEDEALGFLADFVQQGLRARLATGNILSGSLVVQLIELPNAPLAVMDLSAEPYPTLPAGPPEITDVADTAEDVLQRIDDLPIEQLLESAINLMNSIDQIARDEAVTAVPESLVGLIDDSRALIASEDIQAIAPEVRALISDLDAVVEGLGAVNLPDRVASILGQVDIIAADIAESSTNWPEISAEVQTLLETSNALQLDVLVEEANTALAQITALLASDAVAALPESLVSTLEQTQSAISEVEGLIASEATQAIPSDIRTTLGRLDGLIAELEAAGTLADIDRTVENAESTLAEISAASANLPEIMSELEAFVVSANEIPLSELASAADGALSSIDTLLSSESTQALPGSLTATLTDTQALIQALQDAGTVENVNSALSAADAAAQAIEVATADIPSLISQLEIFAQNANDLELQSLVDSATATLETIEVLLASEGAQDLPENLSSALAELDVFLREVREGGAIDNVNAALASASSAAQAIEDAADGLPALSQQATALVAETQRVLESYGARSRFNSETLSTLRDIQQAADAISALARTIQRNPSSLLTGR